MSVRSPSSLAGSSLMATRTSSNALFSLNGSVGSSPSKLKPNNNNNDNNNDNNNEDTTQQQQNRKSEDNEEQHSPMNESIDAGLEPIGYNFDDDATLDSLPDWSDNDETSHSANNEETAMVEVILSNDVTSLDKHHEPQSQTESVDAVQQANKSNIQEIGSQEPAVEVNTEHADFEKNDDLQSEIEGASEDAVEQDNMPEEANNHENNEAPVLEVNPVVHGPQSEIKDRSIALEAPIQQQQQQNDKAEIGFHKNKEEPAVKMENQTQQDETPVSTQSRIEDLAVNDVKEASLNKNNEEPVIEVNPDAPIDRKEESLLPSTTKDPSEVEIQQANKNNVQEAEFGEDNRKTTVEVNTEANIEQNGDGIHHELEYGFVSSLPQSDTIQNLSKELVQQAAEDALAIMRLFATKGPLVKLHEYYQTKGIGGISSCFKHSTLDIIPSGTQRILRRATFTCPISNQTVACKVPLAILCLDCADYSVPCDELTNLCADLFKYFQLHDGQVYFSTKRGAQKSAALAQLLTLPHQDVFGNVGASLSNPQSTTSASTTSITSNGSDPEAIVTPSPTSTHFPITANGFILPAPSKEEADRAILADSSAGRKTKRFPEWVLNLYKHGVPDLEVTYREVVLPRSIINGISDSSDLTYDLAWQGQPTLIRCTLSISRPIPVTVSGSASSSKSAARKDAVGKLTKMIRDECAKDPLELMNDNQSDALEQKAKLLNCDSPGVEYIHSLPRWSTERVTSSTGQLFLYEIVIRTSTGKLAHELSRFGVVLAVGIDPNISEYTSQFSPKAGGTKPIDMFRVQLIKRGVIDLEDIIEETHLPAEDVIMHLERFNRKLAEHKTYGIADLRPYDYAASTRRSPLARGCFFVPLESNDNTNIEATQDTTSLVSIDWDLLRRVSDDEWHAYLQPTTIGRIIQSQEYILVFYGMVMALTLVCEISQAARDTVSSVLLFNNFPSWEQLPLVLLALVAGVVIVAPKSQASLPWSVIMNRFCILELPKKRPNVFLVDRLSSNNAMSTMTSYDANNNTIKRLKREGRIISYDAYYSNRYKLSLQFPSAQLLDATRVVVHNPLNVGEMRTGEKCQLIPELVRILPLPCDMLYGLAMAARFMPALENDIGIKHECRTFYTMGSKVHAHFGLGQQKRFRYVRNHQLGHPRARSFPSLVQEATSLAPSAQYQRLEFLGDSVLGYFISLNIFGRNSSLKWHSEDISEIGSIAGRNKSLYSGALRLGLNRLIRGHPVPWIDQFTEMPNPETAGKRQSHFVHFIQDKTMSDVAESLLGACYIHGMGNDDDWAGGNCVIALLELLCLALPDSDDKNAKTSSWSRAKSSCLVNGYPFDQDDEWRVQLVSAGTTIFRDPASSLVLQECCHYVHGILASLTSTAEIRLLRQLETKQSKLLMYIALFDDNVERIRHNPSGYVMTEGYSESPNPGDNMAKISRLRDTMFHVGAYALQLMITEEIFRLYPQATSGDMNLNRNCVIADDVVAYITLKRGLFRPLIEKWNDDDNVQRFQTSMGNADRMGLERWQKAGGWMLRGGLNEFERRMGELFNRTDDMVSPSYPGILCGRLVGESSKIPRYITAKIMLTFKCMVGSLVLAVGTEAMWCLIGPLFHEVLLISADELRAEYPNEALCQTYTKGK